MLFREYDKTRNNAVRVYENYSVCQVVSAGAKPALCRFPKPTRYLQCHCRLTSQTPSVIPQANELAGYHRQMVARLTVVVPYKFTCVNLRYVVAEIVPRTPAAGSRFSSDSRNCVA